MPKLGELDKGSIALNINSHYYDRQSMGTSIYPFQHSKKTVHLQTLFFFLNSKALA